MAKPATPLINHEVAQTARKKAGKRLVIRRQYQLLLMSTPFVLLVMLFSFGPLWGWIMAFQHYKVALGLWQSPWAGFDNFRLLFQDPQFFNALRNTVVMGVLNLVTSFIGAIGLALLLNEVRFVFFKRVIQTLTYIPHFVSWVVIANIFATLLSPDAGVVNAILLKLGFIHEPIYFLGEEKLFWWIHTAANFWKELGWNTIIYLAVLVGLNPEHYEAAEVDGATRWQKMRYISIPGLMPTAILLLILSVGWIVQSGYESQFLLGNPVVINRSEVLDLYALNYSTSIGDYSYGVAVSMFKSIVSLVLVLLVNYTARKTSGSRLF
ncbi:putative aldouronate transport system permease protein [Paenibacillus sp. BK033]|uniref:ABC transporter permease n=1 Tax=Paenibacillus sp. BK033 TaxID=2512133 RepID=UPI0010457F33|nr:ABC transporter permease subunit [Paenibacillus sp. BK033]TCM97054.1 putative aldouronate transport system permease protein [Paenibacillus sp. BK033]